LESDGYAVHTFQCVISVDTGFLVDSRMLKVLHFERARKWTVVHIKSEFRQYCKDIWAMSRSVFLSTFITYTIL
jgi:hypothetical protein